MNCLKSIYKIFRIFVLLIIISIIDPAIITAQLSGPYVIDPYGGGNYTTLNEAVTALTSLGVSGPVIMNIADGTYDEQVSIPPITGAGAVNTITFTSASGSAEDVFISYSGYESSTWNFTVLFNSCDYITFKDMTFVATGGNPSYGRIFVLQNGADHNTIQGNILYGKSSGTTNYNTLIYASGTTDEYNTIQGNTFYYGEGGVYFSGINSGTLSAENYIINNTFNDQNGTAILLRYQSRCTVSNNIITNSNTGRTGIYLEYADYDITVTKNKLSLEDPVAGIYLYRCDGSLGMEGLIANNFIGITNIAGYDNYGIHINSSTYQLIYHNSVNVSGAWKETSCALYQTSGGSNLDIQNNIFANFAGGYAFYLSTGSALSESDYNNYYTLGNNLANWSGSNISNLDDLQTLNGGDVNSISVNPVFTSETNLHTSTFRLESMGANLSADVPDDIDGEARSATPDIGADEFTGTGLALSGLYTIGPTGDYTTISDAADDLNKYGVSNAVTFSILSSGSPYNEQFQILPVSGANQADNVTFQSSTGNAEDVEITFKATSAKPYTVLLERAGYVNFETLTISATDSTYSTALEMAGFCSNISVGNCIINSINNTYNTAAIYSKDDLLESIDIYGNSIKDGAYGIFLEGTGSVKSDNISVMGNSIKDQYNGGIYIRYSIAPSVKANNITGDSIAYYYYAIYLRDCNDDYSVSENLITAYDEYGGIQVYNCDGVTSKRGMIANNMINLGGEGGISMTGISTVNSDYVNVYFNTVRIISSNTSINSYAYYNTAGANINVLNNIFCNFGKGIAYNNNSAASISSSNNNCLWTNGSIIARWGTTECQTLDDFIITSSTDEKSIVVNPAFLGDTDLHANSFYLDGAGLQIAGMDEDFDGDIRANPPDIGADEYSSSLYPMDDGTYTIGGITPHYNTIKEAMDDLQIRGVLAQTTFVIRSGEYNNYIGNIYKIPGASAQNSVTLTSESGNNEDVTIYYSTTNEEGNIFNFINVNYFTIKNLTISSMGVTSGRPIFISGSIKDFKLLNNRFISANPDWSNIYVDGISDSVQITDNIISQGRSGIYIGGNSSQYSTNTIISGNSIENTTVEGIQLRYQASPEVIENKIVNQTYASFDGIYLRDCSSEILVTGNTVKSSDSGNGIYLNNCDALDPFSGLISNNMIQVGGASSAYGIYVYGSDRMFLFYNTVNLTSSSSIGSSFYIFSNNNVIRLVNNIMANTGSGYALLIDDPGDVLASDYNDIFTTSQEKFVNCGAEFSDLSDLQTTIGWDFNSLSIDPLFISETDLHSRQSGLIGKGTPLAEVPYDIDSILRDPEHPDIGAAKIQCLLEMIVDTTIDVSCNGQNDGMINITVTGNAPPCTYDWSNGETTEDVSGLAPGKYFVTVTDTNLCFVSDTAIITEPVLLTSDITDSINITLPEGSDGQATVTPAGGTPSYAYLWDDASNSTDSTVTGLLANRYYHVTVTDFNGCFTLDSVILSEPGILRVDITDSTEISCNGLSDGTATATVWGGDPPYVLTWNDDDTAKTNLVTGLGSERWYRVVVTDIKGQIARDSIMLPEPETFVISKNYSDRICSGDKNGFINLDVDGGTAPYTFLWNTGEDTCVLEGLDIGEYVLNITDANGCTMNDTTHIDIYAVYEGEEICMVTVSSANRLLIVWEKTEGKGTAYYKIYRRGITGGFDNIGTQPYESLSVFQDEASVPDEMSYEYKINAVDSCGNESELSPLHKSIHLNASRGDNVMNLVWNEYTGYEYFNYQIYRGSSFMDLHKYRLVPYTNLTYTDTDPPGGVLYYRIGASKLEPCYPSGTAKKGLNEEYELAMSNIDDNGMVSIPDQISKEDLLIYPNPANNSATLYFNNPECKSYTLYLLDLSGKACRVVNDINTSEYELERNDLKAGLYFIELRGEKVFRGKFMIE